jgi:hypothetical protein
VQSPICSCRCVGLPLFMLRSVHFEYLMCAMVEVSESALAAILGELRNLAASNVVITQQYEAFRVDFAANAAAIIGRLSTLERAVYSPLPQHLASGGVDAASCATTLPSLFSHPPSNAPVPDLSSLPCGGHLSVAHGQQAPPPTMCAVWACPVCGQPMKDASSFKSHVSKLYHAKKRCRPRCYLDIARSRHRKMVVNFLGPTDAAKGDSFVNQFYAHVVVACSSRMTELESHSSVYGWLRQHLPSDVDVVPVHVTHVGALTSSSSPSSFSSSGPHSGSSYSPQSSSHESFGCSGADAVASAPGFDLNARL